MKQAATVKVISEHKSDIEQIARVLEKHFKVIATSCVIFDGKLKRYHQFLNIVNSGGDSDE